MFVCVCSDISYNEFTELPDVFPLTAPLLQMYVNPHSLVLGFVLTRIFTSCLSCVCLSVFCVHVTVTRRTMRCRAHCLPRRSYCQSNPCASVCLHLRLLTCPVAICSLLCLCILFVCLFARVCVCLSITARFKIIDYGARWIRYCRLCYQNSCHCMSVCSSVCLCRGLTSAEDTASEQSVGPVA